MKFLKESDTHRKRKCEKQTSKCSQIHKEKKNTKKRRKKILHTQNPNL